MRNEHNNAIERFTLPPCGDGTLLQPCMFLSCFDLDDKIQSFFFFYSRNFASFYSKHVLPAVFFFNLVPVHATIMLHNVFLMHVTSSFNYLLLDDKVAYLVITGIISKRFSRTV